jgi:hypothetical protein
VVGRRLIVFLGIAAALMLTLVLLVPAGSASASPSRTVTPAGAPATMPTGMPSPSSSGWTNPMPTPSPTSTSGSWCGGGIWSGSGAWGGIGMWGMGFGRTWLEGHPRAFQAWLDLMTRHRAALKDWYDTRRSHHVVAQPKVLP